MKLTGRFESLIEDLVKEKLTSHAAKRHRIELSEDEVRAILAEQPAFVPHIDDFIAVTRLRIERIRKRPP